MQVLNWHNLKNLYTNLPLSNSTQMVMELRDTNLMANKSPTISKIKSKSSE